jgi:hypothetical protein
MKFFNKNRVIALILTPVIIFTISLLLNQYNKSSLIGATLGTILSWSLELTLNEPKLKVNWELLFLLIITPVMTNAAFLLITPPHNKQELITTMLIATTAAILAITAQLTLVGIPGRKKLQVATGKKS